MTIKVVAQKRAGATAFWLLDLTNNRPIKQRPKASNTVLIMLFTTRLSGKIRCVKPTEVGSPNTDNMLETDNSARINPIVMKANEM